MCVYIYIYTYIYIYIYIYDCRVAMSPFFSEDMKLFHILFFHILNFYFCNKMCSFIYLYENLVCI